MNAYQRTKVEASIVFLKYMQALVAEMVGHAIAHRRHCYTVSTKEIVERLCDAELIWVRCKSHTNDSKKKAEYDFIRLPSLLETMIGQLTEELRLMGDRNAA